MTKIRGVAAVSAFALVSAAVVAVTASPAAASPSTLTVTALDQSAIAQYYQSKEVIARGAQPVAVNTASVKAGSSVGSTYVQDFYAGYADDPDLTVKGVSITPTVLSKVASGSSTTFRVSVRVSFSLYDKTDGSAFTGGETLDHEVLASSSAAVAGPTTSSANAQTTYTVSADTALDVSTAPFAVVPSDDEDAQLAKVPVKVLPDWQTKLKQQNNDLPGKGLSTAVADGESGGSAASEDKAELADLAKTAAAADDDAEAAYGIDSAAKSTNYFPQLGWQKSADYAALWTDDDHAGKLNSKYGDASDNCTNFVSQALVAGGWKTRNTTYAGRKWKSRWHWNYRGPGHFTYSWSRAHYNYRRMVAVGNRPTFSKLGDSALADLAFFDWDVGGATYGDGQMDHVMIVTKRTKKHPYFSQKSGNRHNVPPKEVVKNIGNHRYTFYGIRT